MAFAVFDYHFGSAENQTGEGCRGQGSDKPSGGISLDRLLEKVSRAQFLLDPVAGLIDFLSLTCQKDSQLCFSSFCIHCWSFCHSARVYSKSWSVLPIFL